MVNAQFIVPENTVSCIATLNGAIKIIPVIKDAQTKIRVRLTLLTPQASVKQPLFRAGCHSVSTDTIAVIIRHRSIQFEHGRFDSSRVITQPKATSILGKSSEDSNKRHKNKKDLSHEIFRI